MVVKTPELVVVPTNALELVVTTTTPELVVVTTTTPELVVVVKALELVVLEEVMDEEHGVKP